VWTRGRDAGVRQIEASFGKLRTDVIDLLQVHNLLDWSTHLATLKEMKAQGRVRYIGITTSQGWRHGDLADLIEVVRVFLDAGGSLIDSSPMYGRAEAVVGRVLARLGRRDVFFATKVWTKEGREAGIAQMEASERLMGARRIDLMQIHNLVGYATHLKTLRAWKEEGRVRYVGATEMRDWTEVERILREDQLDFIQVPYSMVEREVEARVLPAALEHGVAVLVMRPFQRAGLFDKVEGKPLPDWAAEIDCTSWAQFFLKWVLGHPAVTCPIPATSKPQHMADNMLAGVGRLPDEALRKRMLAELGL
jgi:aryl-alcohol dehydrogenase-like predicted oxidoreductase